jgi:hypothetical protein
VAEFDLHGANKSTRRLDAQQKTARRLWPTPANSGLLAAVKMWKALGALVAVMILLAGGALVFREALVNLWLKNHLAGKLAEILGADIRLDEVGWSNGILRAGNLRISGGELPFARCDAANINLPIEWKDLIDSNRPTLNIEAGSLELVWQTPRGQATTRADSTPTMNFSIARFSFRHAENPAWSLRDVPLQATHKDGTWDFAARGGTVIVSESPPLRLERASAKHTGHTLQIEEFAVSEPNGGSLTGQAKHNGGGWWTANFTWQNLDLASLPGWRWVDHFTGKTEGNATLENGVLRGQMIIRGAQTKAVPQLVKLAGLFAGENWNTMPWETLRFDFVRDTQGRVEFSNLEAISSRGLAVRGAGHYSPDNLGANVQLGVALAGRPWLRAFVPALFRNEEQGYLWTPVNVGGTPAAPTEDLTTRVVAALAMAPVEGAVETATDLPGAAVEAAGGLLRGLLGN